MMEVEAELRQWLWWLRGSKMRSGGQGGGAGCAMKVGICSPGINTDTPLAYTVIWKFKHKCKRYYVAI